MKETTQGSTPDEAVKPTVKKFDGFVDIIDPNIDGTYTTRREKFYLSADELTAFMGDADPFTYWREGRVPVMYAKEFGRMLNEAQDEEVTVTNKVFAKFPGVIVFRHKHQSLYTLLVPKSYSDLEKTPNGEYANRLTFCDARTIVFGAQDGGMFTEKSFVKKAKTILSHIAKTNSDDYMSA